LGALTQSRNKGGALAPGAVHVGCKIERRIISHLLTIEISGSHPLDAQSVFGIFIFCGALELERRTKIYNKNTPI
jgi:hypothetical protein